MYGQKKVTKEKAAPDGATTPLRFSPESALSRFAIGQRVHVRCDGCRAGITATVDYIAAEAEYTPPVIFSEESRSKLVYLVEARPNREDAQALHPGQPVQVSLP